MYLLTNTSYKKKMRLRNVKGSRETIAVSKWVITEPEKLKGNWKSYFGNDNPVAIEIGMGKGQFIIELARRNPDINYIGIEKFSSVLVRAIEKMDQLDANQAPDNLVFLRFDAENIADIFDEGEVSKIYLNFSDPWPKDRHAKRRLTSPQFLERYDKILAKEGKVEFKTDNQDLFDFSLESVNESKWNLELEEWDLHNSEHVDGNIMTEYEARFSAEGKPICKMVISR